jgi:hypothetical protein
MRVWASRCRKVDDVDCSEQGQGHAQVYEGAWALGQVIRRFPQGFDDRLQLIHPRHFAYF